MDKLIPKTHQEAVAVFRHGLIGALTQAQMDRGQLQAALKQLTHQRFLPPRAKTTRSYSVATLERWYYGFKKRGLPGLLPGARKDKGRGRKLTPELRELLCDIRREYPSASARLILSTLVADGRMSKGTASATTLRRLFVDAGLDKLSLRDGVGANVVALEAHHTEREVDMLGLFVRALRRHGKPDALFLDNGSTYRGDTLATACARLGITLVHARPYDPQARGKMERFWRTAREGCIDFLGSPSSLHDVNVRLLAFLDAHYHRAPHAGLFGRAPADVFKMAPPSPAGWDEKSLREALTTRIRRRVRRDTTVSIDGVDYELDAGHLAGRIVTLCRCLVDLSEKPWVEFEGKRLDVHPVDPVKNSGLKRPLRRPHLDQTAPRHTAFDPPKALLDKVTGRRPQHEGGES